MLEFQDDEGKAVGADDVMEFDHVSFTINKGVYTGQKFIAEFDVCKNPACDCDDLHFEITRQNEAQDGYDFTVNIKTRLLSESTPVQGETKQLGDAVLSELTAADWEDLENIFFTAKADLSEEFDIADCELEFPENDDMCFYYDEVLPYASPFFFTDKSGDEMAAVDSYFIDPQDPGSELALLIHPTDAEEESEVDEESAALILVDYNKQRMTQVEKTSNKYDAATFIPRLLEANPDLWQRLARRHKNLQDLYAKYGKQSPKKHAPAVSDKKAGRNDLCPCGSGKKYKKCCGQ